MKIEEKNHGAVTVLKPVGPVAKEDADTLLERLLEARARSLGRLVLDAAAVPYIDSRGLEVLLDVSDELGRSGQTLKLSGLQEAVREVLELTDLASTFDHYDDVSTAARSFL